MSIDILLELACRCVRIGMITVALVILSLLLCHVAFALRTYALYEHDSRIRNLLLVLLASETGLMIYTNIAGLYAPTMQSMQSMQPHVRMQEQGCLSTVPNNPYGILSCSIPFAFDFIIFALTLARSITFLRTNVQAPVIPVLLRDGMSASHV